MKNTSLTIKVPGKLMIAGEYSVLSTGYPAIVIAIDRYITIKISRCNLFKISYHAFERPEVTWAFDQDGAILGLDGDEYSFIKEAITIAYQFLKRNDVEISPFHLQIQNGLNDIVSSKKYGLGSSAAIVVGVISAMLAFYDQEIDKERLELYKLSCIAHLKAQGNGSGADIAASVYGGWLCYYRYDVQWLLQKLYDQKEGILDLIHMPWPNLCIERIAPPSSISLITGWTKHTAKTSPLVNKIEAFQRVSTEQYEVFLEQSKASVEEFIRACELEDGAGILHAIGMNRSALQYLSDITGIRLETKEIRALCLIADKFGKGKFSGAGGGDCGIAFILKDDGMKALKQEWEQVGIMPLDLQVSEQGVIQVESIEP